MDDMNNADPATILTYKNFGPRTQKVFDLFDLGNENIGITLSVSATTPDQLSRKLVIISFRAVDTTNNTSEQVVQIAYERSEFEQCLANWTEMLHLQDEAYDELPVRGKIMNVPPNTKIPWKK